MDIQLVSQDPELCRLCREVLDELPGQFAISVAGAEDLPSDAAFYIYDFGSVRPIPAIVHKNPPKRLFLIDLKDLPALHDQFADETNILLKPFTRGTLGIFLEQLLTGSGSALQTILNLQVYDHERTNFLAHAVHDFRAPLTALSGYCGL